MKYPPINLNIFNSYLLPSGSQIRARAIEQKCLIIEEVVCHRTTLISGNETFGFSFPHEALMQLTVFQFKAFTLNWK